MIAGSTWAPASAASAAAGVGVVTVTGAVSVAVTFGPAGGVPVAVALFVNEAVTFASAQLYVTLAPGAIEASAGIVELDVLQPGARASETVTFVSVTLPVFVTVIVKFAVPPLAIVCDFGFFVIEIAGLFGRRRGGLGTVSGSQAPVERDVVRIAAVGRLERVAAGRERPDGVRRRDAGRQSRRAGRGRGARAVGGERTGSSPCRSERAADLARDRCEVGDRGAGLTRR